MSHAALPQGVELGVLLRSAGMIDANPSDTQQLQDFAAACNAASAEWNKVTGYTPFLANASDVLRKFDPPGPTIDGTRYGWRTRGGQRRLMLDNSLVSLTSVTTNVDANNAGTVRVLGTDFFLHPNNAAADGVPWREIEFVVPVWGIQQSIQVLGKWGYAATCPDDAWQAILYMAALHCVSQLEFGSFGGLLKWSAADASETYSANPFDGTVSRWQKYIDRTKLNYLRDV